MSGPHKRKIDLNVLKLISTIKAHECLWNINNDNYNTRGLVTKQAWADVAEKTDKKGPIVRVKWKNLKDSYRKELQKNFQDGEYKGTWLYFEELDFLRNSIFSAAKVEELGYFSDDEINEEVQEVIRSGLMFKRKTDYGTVRLLAEVKKQECLWKKDSVHIDVNKTRSRAWQTISEKLGLPGDELRRKWKNLRYTFRREMMKNYFNGEYRGIWQYFNLISFIKHDMFDIEEIEDCEGMPSENEAESDAEVTSDEEEITQPQLGNINNHVEIKVEALDNIDIEYLNEAIGNDPIAEKRARLEDDEYDHMFLKSLVPFFRGMDPERKLVLRSKIQDMILKEIATTS